MDNIIHPNVSIIWNFWPLSLVLWFVARAPLNFFLLPLWIISVPFYELWNFVPDSLSLAAYLGCLVALPTLFVSLLVEIFLLFFLPYVYLTALPDAFPVLGIFTSLAVLTGGSFDFAKPGDDAVLPASAEWGINKAS